MAAAEVALVGVDSIARNQNNRSAASYAIRENLALTTSYVQGGANTNYFKCLGYDQITLEFTLTWVDSTSVEWYVEWSSDGTNWFRSLNYSASAGVITGVANNATIANSASAKWADSFPVQDVYCRVSFKKTGGVGADALAVTAVGLTV